MSLGHGLPRLSEAAHGRRGFPPELATSRALEGYRRNVLLFERLAARSRALGGFGKPTIIVAAAGNESRTDVNPDFKIAVSPPAVSDGIISVAALGRGDGRLRGRALLQHGCAGRRARAWTSRRRSRGGG